MLDYAIQTLYNMGDTLLMFVDSVVSIGLWALAGLLVYSVIKLFTGNKKSKQTLGHGSIYYVVHGTKHNHKSVSIAKKGDY